ncbi:MAG: hypothetical protein IPN76_17410 [Saprospiraceae bacterium]|nr:hypothetical protein [Saprospiraceae bacterium]
MKRTMIKHGFDLLKKEKGYSNAKVKEKLETLGAEIARSTISNILTGKPTSDATLLQVANKLQELTMMELGHVWDGNQFIFQPPTDWQSQPVLPTSPNSPSLVIKPGFAFHDKGRLEIKEKVAFMQLAEKEVIEFGVTLNTFSNYFDSRSDDEFAGQIKQLLENGVCFKCYLLDPDSNVARVYFNDSTARKNDESKIRSAMERLRALKAKFDNSPSTKGKFQVFKYAHIPNNYFLAVDGEHLMLSHYIYGEKRANCPVIELHKVETPTLFRRYYDSLEKLIADAKPI